MLLREKPYFLISKRQVFENYSALRKLGFLVSYSWKTNPEVGKILNELEDCFFSVHSLNELKQISNFKNIWFFCHALTCEELDLCVKGYGLKNFVVDCETDLNLLVSYVERNNLLVSLLLRMKVKEHSVFTERHFVYGMDLQMIKKNVRELESHPNIESVGIHIHQRTQNVSSWNFLDEIVENLTDELGKIDVINVGGGLPTNYKNTHARVLPSIFSKLELFREKVEGFGVRVFVEPGRFVASSCVKLVCHIMAIEKNVCFLDVSVFNGMLDTIVANVKLPVKGEVEGGKYCYLLKGCTPDSCDIIRYRACFDCERQVGDLVVFENCGAYTYTTNFCALEKIEVKVVEKF